jgi:hypothetical protein
MQIRQRSLTETIDNILKNAYYIHVNLYNSESKKKMSPILKENLNRRCVRHY